MSSFWNHVFGFSTVKMPTEPAGDFQTAAILLRVIGWMQAVGAALIVLVTFLILPLRAAGANGTTPWSEAPGWVQSAAMAAMVLAVLFGLALAAAILYWVGWLLSNWADRTPRACSQLQVFAIVLLVFCALAMVGGLGGLNFFSYSYSQSYNDQAFSTGFGAGLPFGGLTNPIGLVQLGLAIWLLVIVNKDEVQALFEAESPSVSESN